MKDGGSAFPVFEEARANRDGSPCTDYVLTSPGMTLRDWFAGQAIKAIMGPADIEYLGDVIDAAPGFAEVAYAVADAMIAQREADTAKEA